jgi:transposase
LEEDVGMGKGSTTRRYSDEFKRDAVALFRSSGRPIKEVARELGISDTSLGTWVRESEKNAPAGEVASAKEEARLLKRIGELEEEIEILKRFTRYWVKEEGK